MERKLKDQKINHSDDKPFLSRFGFGFGSKSDGNRTKHEIKRHQDISNKDAENLIHSTM